MLFSALVRCSFILKIQSYKNSPELRTRLAASDRKKNIFNYKSELRYIYNYKCIIIIKFNTDMKIKINLYKNTRIENKC